MKKIVALLTCWYAFTCNAQTADPVNQLASSYFKETEAATQNQHIWKEKIYGRMLFVDPQTRITYSNTPDSVGILKPEGDIYKGVLPKDVMIANTSITWEGKLWSVMLWPMLTDRDERVTLMVHESFHRIQRKMGFPDRSLTVDHLSTMEGRIYFLLELQALKAALEKPIDQRNADLTHALIFREKQHELFTETFANEQILEMNEGLAEYTGVILGRPKNHIRKHLYDQIDTAGNRKSFIRSVAYITGPVYGYLLYEKAPDWTLKADSNSDFPLLIAKYYHLNMPGHQSDKEMASLMKKYNGDAITASEKQKEEKRLEAIKQYTELFTKKQVLTITLKKMGINFNPNNLFDLGEFGTVYPTAEIKDIWGQLVVSSTGVLMKDWHVITLSADKGISATGQVIEGYGWKITLKEGWALEKVDAMHYQLVNKN